MCKPKGSVLVWGFFKIQKKCIQHKLMYWAANTQNMHIQYLGWKHPCNIHAAWLVLFPFSKSLWKIFRSEQILPQTTTFWNPTLEKFKGCEWKQDLFAVFNVLHHVATRVHLCKNICVHRNSTKRNFGSAFEGFLNTYIHIHVSVSCFFKLLLSWTKNDFCPLFFSTLSGYTITSSGLLLYLMFFSFFITVLQKAFGLIVNFLSLFFSFLSPALIVYLWKCVSEVFALAGSTVVIFMSLPSVCYSSSGFLLFACYVFAWTWYTLWVFLWYWLVYLA